MIYFKNACIPNAVLSNVLSRYLPNALVVQGPQGPQGAPGNGGDGSGSQGPQGFQGARGFQGFQGVAGTQGNQGTAGSAGSQGPQGFQGNQGATGSGTQGNQGFQGAAGSAGSQGPQGFQGAAGSAGSQGPQGFQGATGSGTQGFQGAQGAQGFQGAEGIGSGTQGAQGFQGVQGAQGATGTQGNQGFQGVAGTGAQGPQGFQGNTGSTGTQGNQGFQGTQGATGTTGTQGNQGFQGVQGAQGFQGATGTGTQGNQGFQGFQGPQGIAGDGSDLVIGTDVQAWSATLDELSDTNFGASSSGATLDLGSDTHIRWSTTSLATGTKDVGIKRTGAGELTITDGDTGVANISIDDLVVGTLTGMIKASSGAFSVATEGTDYLSGASNKLPLPFTFGGTGVPAVANDVTPWLYVAHAATAVRLTLTCKVAPSGNFQITIKRSADSGSTFPDTVASITVSSGNKIATTTTMTTASLAAGNYLRCDVISVNSADTWSARLETLSTNS